MTLSLDLLCPILLILSICYQIQWIIQRDYGIQDRTFHKMNNRQTVETLRDKYKYSRDMQLNHFRII